MRFYRYTLFNTPLLTSLFRIGSHLVLKLRGWKIRGKPPNLRKFIVIAYPHTTNWDVPLTLAISLRFGLHVHWMGKSSLFRGPMGPLMKWLGGIPVHFDRSTNLVQQTVEAFASTDELIVTIAPEGARAYVDRWKTGFYHIALGAGVPIVLGFLDFAKKEGGYLGSFQPSGDLESDLAAMAAAYAGIQGKYPHQSR